MRPALLVPGRRQQRPGRADRARAQRAPLPVPSYQLDRGKFENFLAEQALEAGIDLFGGSCINDVEVGDPHRVTIAATPAARSRDDRGALARRRRRARLHPQAQARSARGQRPRRQLVLVQARRRARHRGLGRPRRRGVLRAHGRARAAQAQHQPHLRRGLLGLADPALLRPDLDRHRRRPALPSLGGDEHARRRDRVDPPSTSRSSASRSTRGATRSRTSSRSRTSRTAQAGVLRRATAGVWSARRGRSSTRSTPRARTTSRSPTRSRPT